MRVASIDMGTNTVRLLIAELSGECSLHIIHQESIITRLGEGFGKVSLITDRAAKRTTEVLVRYRNLMKSYGVEKFIVLATSAIREASNGQWFIEHLKEFGFSVRVIQPDEEARLTHRGILYFLKPQISNKEWVAFDLGGGSTEFMLSHGRELIKTTSIPVGVVKLLERFVHSDPPSPAELNSVEVFFKQQMKSFLNGWEKQEFLVGNAGTVTTLAAMDLGLKKYQYSQTEGHILKQGNIRRLCNILSSMTSKERLDKFPILQKGREDVITVGCVVTVSVMEYFNSKELIVTNGSLREGALLDSFC